MTRGRVVLYLREKRYERACWWLNRGIDIVPLKPGSKHLHPGFGSRRAHITEIASARKWFLNANANLGVVLGQDGGLIVADWDSVQDYEAWRDATGATVDTLAERTARGYHLFFFGKGLASAVGNGCEFKASGVCMVSPSVHPSGAVYRVVNDTPIVSVNERRACALFPFLSRVRRTRQRVALTNAPKGDLSQSRKTGVPESAGVISRIKAVRSIMDEMNSAGVILRPGGRNAVVGLCLFHDDHSPSLWVNPESGLWGCNQPRCPAAGVHDVINFRASRRGISNSVAIRELARECL